MKGVTDNNGRVTETSSQLRWKQDLLKPADPTRVLRAFRAHCRLAMSARFFQISNASAVTQVAASVPDPKQLRSAAANLVLMTVDDITNFSAQMSDALADHPFGGQLRIIRRAVLSGNLDVQDPSVDALLWNQARIALLNKRDSFATLMKWARTDIDQAIEPGAQAVAGSFLYQGAKHAYSRYEMGAARLLFRFERDLGMTQFWEALNGWNNAKLADFMSNPNALGSVSVDQPSGYTTANFAISTTGGCELGIRPALPKRHTLPTYVSHGHFELVKNIASAAGLYDPSDPLGTQRIDAMIGNTRGLSLSQMRQCRERPDVGLQWTLQP